MPVCNLCNRDVVALVRSHITPSAFIVDPNNRGVAIPVVSTTGVGRTLTGHYDQIICEACERAFSACDTEAIRFARELEHGKPTLSSTGELMYREYRDANITQLIRFGQTLLYRAQLTSGHFYESVEVGPFYPRLKEIVHSGGVGGEDEFSVMVVTVGGALANTTIGPIKVRMGPVNCYRFHVPGLSIFVKVDRRPFEPAMKHFVLSADRTCVAMHHDSLNGPATASLSALLDRNAPQIDRILGRPGSA